MTASTEPRPVPAVLRHGGRALAAVVAGIPSGFGEALFVLGSLPLILTPARPAVLGTARRIAGWERRRLAFGASRPAPAPLGSRGLRAYAYLAARLLPAALAAVTVGLLGVGAVLAAIVSQSVVDGAMTPAAVAEQILFGTALLALDLQAIAGVARLDRWLAHRLLDDGSRAELRQRITELTASRAGVLEAVDAERRRIERDLHDGLQQRLVALGMLLGRARRSADPQRAHDLLAQAHEDAQRAVDELREVAWRVYPSALDHGTLDDVLTMVAQRSAVPVRIGYGLPERPPRHIETVLYFVASEAITNAAKHADATVLEITIETYGSEVAMLVHDDGRGGADPAGSGLSGLARRVAALDGRFAVDSPPGGGTTIRVALPCG